MNERKEISALKYSFSKCYLLHSLLSFVITEYLKLGNIYKTEVYLNQSSWGWEVPGNGTGIW
jgi:hypothetical protein